MMATRKYLGSIEFPAHTALCVCNPRNVVQTEAVGLCGCRCVGWSIWLRASLIPKRNPPFNYGRSQAWRDNDGTNEETRRRVLGDFTSPCLTAGGFQGTWYVMVSVNKGRATGGEAHGVDRERNAGE